MKICNKCEVKKCESDFNKWNRGKDGLRSTCRECQKLYQKLYRTKNKEVIKGKSAIYNKENKEKIQIYNQSEKRKSQKRFSYHNNKAKCLSRSKLYYIENKDRIKDRNKRYRDSIKNTDKYKKVRRDGYRKYRKTIPHIISWRKIVNRTLCYFGENEIYRTIEYLGYSPNELKIHIESLFSEGMSWENHGEWHIDHIFPLSMFEIGTPSHIVNSLSNLRPLWAFDNLSKGNKIL